MEPMSNDTPDPESPRSLPVEEGAVEVEQQEEQEQEEEEQE